MALMGVTPIPPATSSTPAVAVLLLEMSQMDLAGTQCCESETSCRVVVVWSAVKDIVLATRDTPWYQHSHCLHDMSLHGLGSSNDEARRDKSDQICFALERLA